MHPANGINRNYPGFNVTFDMHERVRQEVRATTMAVWFLGWNPRRCAAVAAVLLLCGVGAFFFADRNSESRLYRAALKDHRDDAVRKVTKQGWRTTPEEIQAFALEHFDTDAFLPSLAPPGFQLKRVRMCNLKGSRFAHFIYEVGGREVSFFVQKRAGDLRGPRMDTVRGGSIYAHGDDGYEVAGFQSAKLTVLIVTHFSRAENIRLASEAAVRLS